VANVTTENSIANYLEVTGANPSAKEYDPANAAKYVEYKKLTEELRTFDRLRPYKGSDTFTAMTELGHADAPPTFVFELGNHERPLEEVQPGFPAAIAKGEQPSIAPTASSSGRRTALAAWIASPRNPLTARVFVNRVWNQYFGRGIVTTLSDFGKAGRKPTHPELLDYLADRFVSQGWSVKALHREILLSSVYRQSSAHREDVRRADPGNTLLAVFPGLRLDAEQIRDSLLAASGELNGDVGGPSVTPPVPKGLNAGQLWLVSPDRADHTRRSRYIFTRRSVAYPLLQSFDMASPQQAHSRRDVTTSPLQALTLYNDAQVFGWSRVLAGRVVRDAGADDAARIDRLYQILFARAPDEIERSTLREFVDRQERIIQDANGPRTALALPAGVAAADERQQPRQAAFVDAVHAPDARPYGHRPAWPRQDKAGAARSCRS